MRSDADDVDTYLAQAPEGRRAVLGEMRAACRTLLAGFAESMNSPAAVDFTVVRSMLTAVAASQGPVC